MESKKSIDRSINSQEDDPTIEWRKAIYLRIRDAYGAETPADVGKFIEKFGKTRQTPYDWEKGRSKPTKKLLELISKDTGHSVKYFLGIESEDNSEPKKPENKKKVEKILDIDDVGCNLFHSLPPGAKAQAIAVLEALKSSYQQKGAPSISVSGKRKLIPITLTAKEKKRKLR